MNFKKIIGIAVIFSFLSAGTIYVYSSITLPDNVKIISSIEKDYPTIEKLYDSTEMIVRGKVTGEETKEHTYKDDEGNEQTLYYTEKEYKIQKVYKGENVKSGDTIRVRTLEADHNDTRQIVGTTIGRNKSYVLFLKESVFPIKNGAYTFVGGPQGIFTLDTKEIHHRYKDIDSLKQLEKTLTQLRNEDK